MARTKHRPLSSGQIIGYSSGNLGKNIVANSLAIFLIYYLTDVLGIDSHIAGLIMVLSIVWDALLDPLVAIVADRTRTALGKYGVFIVLGAPLSAVSFVAIFTLPSISQSPVLVVVICLLAFRAFYTLIDLPHNALLSRISNDSRERTNIAVTRYFFSSVGSLFITIAAFYIFESSATDLQAAQFQRFSILAALVSTLIMWISWISVNHRDRFAPFVREGVGRQLAGVRLFFADRDAVLIFLVSFLTGFAIPIFLSSISYIGKYVLGDETAIAAGLTSIVLGQIASTPFWSRLASRWDKAHALIASHVIFSVGICLFGSMVFNTGPLFLASCFVVGIGSGGIFSIIWGMAPDIVDKLHAQTSIRSEAAFIGVMIVVMKTANGLCAGLIGFSLALLDYTPNVEQTDLTVLGLRILGTFGPLAGAAGAIVLLSRYSLGHRAHAGIVQQLGEQVPSEKDVR